MKKALGPVHMVNRHQAQHSINLLDKLSADASFCSQEKIEAVNQALINEYEVRRKMLLKRLDVTVQSFGWSDRAKVRAVPPAGPDLSHSDLTKGGLTL